MKKKRAAVIGSAVIGAVFSFGFGVASGDAPAAGERVGMFNATSLSTTSGEEVFHQICQGCHMADGKGAVGAAKYPSLAKDPALSSPLYMAITILGGRRNMPPFGAKYASHLFYSPPTLTNEQIAAVINYVRTNFGNHYTKAITTADVEKISNTL
jgi:mono/diheme cytochrome c family protein